MKWNEWNGGKYAPIGMVLVLLLSGSVASLPAADSAGDLAGAAGLSLAERDAGDNASVDADGRVGARARVAVDLPMMRRNRSAEDEKRDGESLGRRIQESCRQSDGRLRAMCNFMTVRGAIRENCDALNATDRPRCVANLALISRMHLKLSDAANETEVELVEDALNSKLRARVIAKFGSEREAEKSKRDRFARFEEKLREFNRAMREVNETDGNRSERVSRAVALGIEARINAALKLEAEGANSTLVEQTVLKLRAALAKFNNAITTEQKREGIREANEAWKEFRREVAKDVLTDRLELAVASAKKLLLRVEASIASLEQKGKDVSLLREQLRRTNGQLDSVLEANITLGEAKHRLAKAKVMTLHLVQNVRRVANDREVVRAEPVFNQTATAEADADLVVNTNSTS